MDTTFTSKKICDIYLLLFLASITLLCIQPDLIGSEKESLWNQTVEEAEFAIPSQLFYQPGMNDSEKEGSEPIIYRSSDHFYTDEPDYRSEELPFLRWDSEFRRQIPGQGPSLPIDTSAPWRWKWMPEGELYRSYFASNREARLGIHFVHEDKMGKDYWDPVLGGKIPLLRWGNQSRLYPEGFQVDIEGAALARLTLDEIRDVYGTDYRFGIPLAYRKGHFEWKLGYYHISSHMGDEWIVEHYRETGEVYRRNYVRDCIMFGVAYRPDANWRFYFGGDYGFYTKDGAEPWQIEAGAEYSPILLPGFRGSPFAAVHFNWNEENNWDTYVAFEAGWQWKTLYQHTLRAGLYIMSGHADQYQFYNRMEKQIGGGLWFDF